MPTDEELAKMGSSPLARGPQKPIGLRHSVGGLIPARAGTTPCLQTKSWRKWAHPRSRGDHILAPDIAGCPTGSSPLARGPRVVMFSCLNVPGLIPARAGTTSPRSPWTLSSGAHPRSRGDHETPNGLNTTDKGSSPLARGTSDRNNDVIAEPRLIPARAGNIAVAQTTAHAQAAHPRSRGEHE